MKLYTVWTNNKTNIGQKCVKNDNGDFIGATTGDTYSKKEHYSSDQIRAKISKIDVNNLTGMYHLAPEVEGGEQNRSEWKSRFIGCEVTVEAAHYCGNHKVYRCLELGGEYFSDMELTLLENDNESWKAYD